MGSVFHDGFQSFQKNFYGLSLCCCQEEKLSGAGGAKQREYDLERKTQSPVFNSYVQIEKTKSKVNIAFHSNSYFIVRVWVGVGEGVDVSIHFNHTRS